MRLIADTSPLARAGDISPDISGLGEGLSILGAGIGRLASKQAEISGRMREQDKAELEKQQRLDEHLQTTKILSGLKVSYIEKFQKGEAMSPEDFNAQAQKTIDEIMADKEAWTPEGRVGLESSAYQLFGGLADDNLRNLSRVEQERKFNDYAESLQNVASIASMSGDHAGARAIIDSLNSRVGANLGARGEAAYRKAVTDIDLSEVQHASDKQGPAAAAAALRSGEIAPGMDQYGRESLAANLDRQEAAQAEVAFAAARENVARISAAAESGNESAIMQLQAAQANLDAASKRYSATRKPVAELDSLLLKQIDQQIQKGRDANVPEGSLAKTRRQLSLATATRSMAGASPGEIDAVYFRRVEVFGEGSDEAMDAEKAAKAAKETLAKDSFAYVMQDPGMQNAYAQATSSGKPEDFQQMLSVIIDRQARFGVSSPRVMSAVMADEQAARIIKMASGEPVAFGNVTRKASPDEVVREIDGITELYGKHAGAALSDLSTLPIEQNRLPVELQVIAAIPKNQGVLRARLAQSLDDAATSKDQPKTVLDAKKADIEKEMAGNTVFQQFAESMFFSVSGDGRAQIEQWGEAVNRYAARLVFTGQAKNERDAVNEATKALVSSIWEFRDGMRIPRTNENGDPINIDSAYYGLDSIRAAILPELDVSAFRPDMPDIDPQRADVLGQKKAASVMRWITSEDGRGAMLVGETSRGEISPMFTKDGRQVIVDFEKAASAAVFSDAMNPSGVDAPSRSREFTSSLSGKSRDFLRGQPPSSFSDSVARILGEPQSRKARPAVDAKRATLTDKGKQQIANKVASASIAAGLPPNAVLALVAQESDFDPNLGMSTSSAKGLFQLLKDDRQKYGLSEDASVDDQIKAGIQKTQENYMAAKNALGREPSAGELYVIHYQGIGAGPRILKNPSASFRDTLNSVRKGWADKVIKANPWLGSIRTNADFIRWSETKMVQRQKKMGVA